MILANAENFIVANGLLFKLQHTKCNRLDTLQCLLVIPEKFENVIFHMFHDSLLGAHYGPLNTYYTIKERYFMHNMFEKLNRYISSCDTCQKQKTKKTKQPAFHPRIPLSYNPMAYLSADIKYMPKGIYVSQLLRVEPSARASSPPANGWRPASHGGPGATRVVVTFIPFLLWAGSTRRD